MNKKIAIVAILGIIAIVSGLVILPKTSRNQDTGSTSITQIPNQPQPTLPPGGAQKTLTGKSICLPHKDTSGPQTMECAFGIQADDGHNYALSMKDSDMTKFQTEKKVTVEGLVVPLEVISNDHWYKYDIRGIMQVESVREN